MTKVITYGTYDLLHYGHIRLLERAKALGDYLIVGVTADTFDRERGKINVQQSLIERVEAVRSTGLADEIVVEEYEGQKIDDIRRYGVDIFTVGSDWKGHFDYLKEYCQVVYLERTEGISSSDIRTEERLLRIGLVGESPIINKFARESLHVNGVTISGVCTKDDSQLNTALRKVACYTDSIDELIDASDALYVISHPRHHFAHVSRALHQGKHVLCEAPIGIDAGEWEALSQLAKDKGCVLMDSIKTAYSTAYYRLLLLAKSGIIGKIVAIDATCTSMHGLTLTPQTDLSNRWNSICAWGPTAMLPVFQLLGTDYSEKSFVTRKAPTDADYDLFSHLRFVYPHAVATVKVGQGVKSEGELVISGTRGYIYVPAPWWKTDYFEVRYENPADNKRYFYQLDGEGIRYEIVSFVKAIQTGNPTPYVSEEVSRAVAEVIGHYYEGKDTVEI